MPSYAKLTIVGNIGDVQAKNSPLGRPYVRLSVAVDDPDEEGPSWYSCIITGKAAETPHNLLKVFRKGRLVLVEGKPKFKSYVKSDGTAGLANTVLVKELPVLLDPKPKDLAD